MAIEVKAVVRHRKNIGGNTMKHIKTINSRNLKDTAAKGGCGECQASCQSACKTSCTVANQKCEK
jgi:predicted ribosomally synthesized six-cysteine peptide SCIFF